MDKIITLKAGTKEWRYKTKIAVPMRSQTGEL
jgi:hypothetical protein